MVIIVQSCTLVAKAIKYAITSLYKHIERMLNHIVVNSINVINSDTGLLELFIRVSKKNK